jgi:uncharacterized SAM-binding protein YcdF (DUF218 family)
LKSFGAEKTDGNQIKHGEQMTEELFLLKKIISCFFLPLSIVAVLMVSGLIFLLLTRKKNLGKILLTLGTILLLLASYGLQNDQLAVSLENLYPPLLDVKNINHSQDIQWIVVLGGGSQSHPRLPLSSQLSQTSLTRLLEGVRLHRMLPGSRLILSGGVVFQSLPESETLAKTAVLMGVSENNIIKEDKSLDTDDQAKLISNILGPKRFILVTSAIHMHRSMVLFRKFGMNPIAAPTNFMPVMRPKNDPRRFFPSPVSIQKTEDTMHEYIGLIWAYVMKKLV